MVVVKDTSVLLYIIQSYINAQGRAIRPVGGYGLNYIGHGKDTSLDENFFSFEISWITGVTSHIKLT